MSREGRTQKPELTVAKPMDPSWIRPVEQIAMTVARKHLRVIGITSPLSGAGVTMLAHALCEAFARSGRSVLLIDLTRPAREDVSVRSVPAQERLLHAAVARDSAGFDHIAVQPGREALFRYGNVEALRRAFVDDIPDYQTVIVDLPATLESNAEGLNPLAAAAACDGVIVLCQRGTLIRSRLECTFDVLRSAGVDVIGTAWNESDYASAGVEMAALARRLSHLAPKTAARLEKWVLRTEWLR
jgi:hypothetical protein